MINQLTDVFRSLEKHDVKYLIIGGIAAILHGVPRSTFDLDILIEATPENARRLLDALVAAGLGTATMVTPEGILAHEVTIFKDRVRVDVQTATPGIILEEAWERRDVMDYRGVKMMVASRKDLIASKRAAGRPVDLEDVRLLTLSPPSTC